MGLPDGPGLSVLRPVEGSTATVTDSPKGVETSSNSHQGWTVQQKLPDLKWQAHFGNQVAPCTCHDSLTRRYVGKDDSSSGHYSRVPGHRSTWPKLQTNPKGTYSLGT